jgi:hypothetical protein
MRFMGRYFFVSSDFLRREEVAGRVWENLVIFLLIMPLFRIAQ